MTCKIRKTKMIEVFSTYTKDFIVDKTKNKKAARRGGPAFFIENVFKKNKVAYKMNAQKAEIKIDLKNGIERGFLNSLLKTKNITTTEKAGLVIISTVDSEWILKNEFSDETKLFLDVQGYIRVAKNDQSIFKYDFWKNIYCMKGTKEEIQQIPKEIIKRQKEKILLVTKGSKGCDIYSKGKKMVLKPKTIAETKNTIGAGDTFFASFIVAFVKNNYNIVESGNFAIKETLIFLNNKR